MTRTLTTCLVGNSRTKLGQLVFGGLNEYILQKCFYGILPYEYSLQINFSRLNFYIKWESYDQNIDCLSQITTLKLCFFSNAP